VNPDELDERSREKYCEVHEMWTFKNAVGAFVCPFCEVSDNE